jgi:pimeloyl-ACP methyl ester carboxylesterase
MYTLAELAADAISVLDTYGCEKAYFVGHSMGGHICQQLALDYPKRVTGFAAISSGPIGATEDTDVPLSELEKATLAKTWALFLEREESKDLEARIKGFLVIWKYLNGSIPFDEQMARAYTIDLLTRTNHEIKSGNNHELVMRVLAQTLLSRRNLIKQIQVPALIIHGAQDPIALPRDAKALANAISGSQLVMIPDMGHMIFNQELESEIALIIRRSIG